MWFMLQVLSAASAISLSFNIKANKQTLTESFVLPSHKATLADTAALLDLFIYSKIQFSYFNLFM